MRGGLSSLFIYPDSYFPHFGRVAYLESGFYVYLFNGWPAFADAKVVALLEAIGEHLCKYPKLPWYSGDQIQWFEETDDDRVDATSAAEPTPLHPTAFLGAAAILSILVESGRIAILSEGPEKFGPLEPLFAYLAARDDTGLVLGSALPELPVPNKFKQTFRNWAEGRVNFTD